MNEAAADVRAFRGRFVTLAQARRYRDRFATGRRARKDQAERAALRQLLSAVGPLDDALDLPSGVGRLAPVLAEFSRRVIQADASSAMLRVAREDHAALGTNSSIYVQADAQRIGLADACVDLVFCHRMLHHIHEAPARAGILAELARVSRRHVILSFYPAGYRDYLRWLTRPLHRPAQRYARPATKRRFLHETVRAGLKLVRTVTLPRFLATGYFYLFERGTPPGR